MGGLTFEKLLVIGIIAVFIFGPERLPQIAETAAALVKRARHWVEDAKQRVSDEVGEDFTAEDWRKLDPRQYDPRRIVRDAWEEAGSERASAPETRRATSTDGDAATAVAGSVSERTITAAGDAANSASGAAGAALRTVPYDDEAT